MVSFIENPYKLLKLYHTGHRQNSPNPIQLMVILRTTQHVLRVLHYIRASTSDILFKFSRRASNLDIVGQ